MHRILVVLGLILSMGQPIQAQHNARPQLSASVIDSLSKRFDAARDDAAKIKVVMSAPLRIDEYFEKPAAILQLYNKALAVAQHLGDRKSTVMLLMEMAYFEMSVRMDEPKAFNL